MAFNECMNLAELLPDFILIQTCYIILHDNVGLLSHAVYIEVLFLLSYQNELSLMIFGFIKFVDKMRLFLELILVMEESDAC